MNPFTVVTSKIYGAGLIVAVTLLGVQTARIEGFPILGGGLKDYAAKGWEAAHMQRDARLEQERAYHLAQEVAEQKARQAITETENRYVAAAWRADNAQAEIDRLRDAAARYAAANRVWRQARGSDGASGHTTSAAEGDAPPSGDGPGEATEFLAISRNDFDTMVENSLRMQRVHQWGTGLMLEGLALPEPDFTP